MNGKLFEILLNALSPKTLAYLIRDLEASQVDWRSYPQDAPPESVQQELTQTLKTIEAVGTELAEADGLDFSQLLQQAIEEQRQEEWTWQRDLQEQQNWTNDLE
jgi:hypothetical protein